MAMTEDEMAAEIARLNILVASQQEEIECDGNAVDLLARILAKISITLKGPELPLHRHSYHDLAEKVEITKLAADLGQAYIEQLNEEIVELKRQVAVKNCVKNID
jgi:hypothetical protein